jgi:hypothetical protein
MIIDTFNKAHLSLQKSFAKLSWNKIRYSQASTESLRIQRDTMKVQTFFLVFFLPWCHLIHEVVVE